MGQKVDPRGLRIGINRTWNSSWFAEGEEYKKYFLEDTQIRKFIKKDYYHTGIEKINIERKQDNQITIVIHTARAGVLIGRKGQEIEILRKKLEKLTKKKVNVKIQEVKMSNKSAQLVAESLAALIENRFSYKRAMKQAITRAEKANTKGIKIMVSGRLNGNDIARSEWVMVGRVPLHTLRAEIDYATAEADTTYGKIGIKVWIFKGETLPAKKRS